MLGLLLVFALDIPEYVYCVIGLWSWGWRGSFVHAHALSVRFRPFRERCRRASEFAQRRLQRSGLPFSKSCFSSLHRKVVIFQALRDE